MSIVRKIVDFICSGLVYVFYTLKVRSVDYFDYKRLIYPRYVTPKGISSVMLYGNWKAVAVLKGSRFNFRHEYLEHGMCFYNATESAEYLGYINRKSIRRIYTYGIVRKTVLDKYLAEKKLVDREVISIGPYIKGADFFHSQADLQLLKQKYGKILLIFPSHSFDDVKTNYEVSAFAQAIEAIKPEFDNVFVCMYWKDVLEKPQEVAFYERQGYVVVCSGHRSDPRFLSRQKDLIYLSDMMMTNDIGSHIGYSICMERPVYFFSQSVSVTQQHLDEIDDGKVVVRTKCRELFGEFSFEITQPQIEFVTQYWGAWKK